MSPTFFPSADEWQAWLAEHHASATELLIGFYKAGSSRRGLTYKEALDEALCFGWIDGVRRSLDEERWTIRFTPRRPKSIWSVVNLKRMDELKAAGRVQPSGLEVFEARDEKRSGLYSFENRPQELAPAQEQLFRAHRKAWTFFSSQAPSYQRTAKFWVVSAKKEETKQKRLALLIECSANGEPIPALRRTPKQ